MDMPDDPFDVDYTPPDFGDLGTEEQREGMTAFALAFHHARDDVRAVLATSSIEAAYKAITAMSNDRLRITLLRMTTEVLQDRLDPNAWRSWMTTRERFEADDD